VPDVQQGRYFVGVVSMYDTDFTIIASAVVASGTTCSSNCSGTTHGSCSSGRCTCQPCYEGDYCETRTCELEVDQLVQGTLESNGWNYYSFEAESDVAMVVQLEEGPSSVDCDLYVKKDSKPSNLDFDYSDVSLGQSNSSVSIAAPMGLYWIGVFGFQSCRYTLHIEEGVDNDCEHDCSGHGNCVSGTCNCTAPWSGDDCSVQMSSLQSGVALNGTVSINQWQYYNFTATGFLLTIQLLERGSNGSVWLFVATEQNPTLSVHDEQDVSYDKAFHHIVVERDTAEPQMYFIGCYGSPISTTNSARPFTLVVWQPPA